MKNELLKLEASFYNNLAVALVAGGGLIPIFTFFAQFIEQHRILANAYFFTLFDVLPILIALLFSFLRFRQRVSVVPKL